MLRFAGIDAPAPSRPRAAAALFVALVFCLLLAFALRMYRLDAQSLWYDEAVSAQVVQKGLVELTRWTADDIQPPLYYYILAAWTRVAGSSEWALRFPSAAFGVLSVALFWALARAVFGRGRIGRIAGLFAAFLGTISPLYVYYGQEARMYTQLTFFGMLAGYTLLRAAESGRTRGAPVWWAGFVFASLAALYTHYFALFLLFSYAVCLIAATLLARLVDWPRARAGVVAFGLIFLGYLPWLPAMLTRYRVDASYWQGTLKLNEALRHVGISLTMGAPETMLEVDAVRWLPWFGVALIVVIVGLVLGNRESGSPPRGVEDASQMHGRKAHRAPRRAGLVTLALLATVSILPVVLVLALASRNPKFNPRYLMIVSPAYLLLLAGGVASWWTANGRMRWARRWLALAAAALLLVSSIIGIRNWFWDPAFTKAQWREVAGYVRAEIGPEERVVLVSGHAAPAWEYYAGDIPPLRLPEIDILDVNAVLGFDAGAPMAEGLGAKDGAWLVTWQDEVVDPAGLGPYFLDRAGEELSVGPSFWHIGLRHWSIHPNAIFPTKPEPEHVQTANFDHKFALLGWDEPVGGDLIVYWSALNTLTKDYQVSLHLEDSAGAEVGRWDGRPAAYAYPATRWQVREPIFGRYPLPLPEGASGEYYVSIAVYAPDAPEGLDVRDVANNPAGKRVRLGPISIGATG